LAIYRGQYLQKIHHEKSILFSFTVADFPYMTLFYSLHIAIFRVYYFATLITVPIAQAVNHQLPTGGSPGSTQDQIKWVLW
jgi:hypothetical protein